MKRYGLCGFCILLATLSFAGEVPESVTLAAGYEQAFQASGKPTVSIFYTTAVQNEEIRGIHSVTACGGVLLVKLRGGSSQILDPVRIVKMSTE